MILTGSARVAGVMGWPVEHSRSPRLHGFWLEQHGIDGAYVPFSVSPPHIREAVRALPRLGLRGVNVTLPHKEAALAACTEVDAVAQRIGAVNTIIVRPDGSLLGTNTDAFGFLESLRQGHPGFDPATGPAIVLGAGGAARAVVAALADCGSPRIRLVNRTRVRAEALVSDLNVSCAIFAWDRLAKALEGGALLVNTTSLGMTGQPPLDLDLASLPVDALVTDIVYAPLQTPLLAAASARGHPVVSGLGMLLHQARPGFKAWFGPDPEVSDELRAFIVADLQTP